MGHEKYHKSSFKWCGMYVIWWPHSQSLWRWMKRRAAIEPGIGRLRRGHRMDRSRLRGEEGDGINAILSTTGMNLRKLLRWLADLLRQFFFWL